MKERGIGERVRARIRRLNPDLQLGQRIRGWNPAFTMKATFWYRDVMGKGKFIRTYGRDAWGRLPPQAISKMGKRCMVAMTAVEGRLWERAAA